MHRGVRRRENVRKLCVRLRQQTRRQSREIVNNLTGNKYLFARVN